MSKIWPSVKNFKDTTLKSTVLFYSGQNDVQIPIFKLIQLQVSTAANISHV